MNFSVMFQINILFRFNLWDLISHWPEVACPRTMISSKSWFFPPWASEKLAISFRIKIDMGLGFRLKQILKLCSNMVWIFELLDCSVWKQILDLIHKHISCFFPSREIWLMKGVFILRRKHRLKANEMNRKIGLFSFEEFSVSTFPYQTTD